MRIARGIARGLVRLAVVVALVLFGLWILLATVGNPFTPVQAMPGLPSVPGATQPTQPSVDQVQLKKATESQAGQSLSAQGYTAQHLVTNRGLVEFLDGQEKRSSVPNPDGLYAVFNKPGSAPDRIVGVSNGVIAGVSQDLATHRGTACYNGKDVREFDRYWSAIMAYLHGKSFDQDLLVGHAQIGAIPKGIGPFQCHTYDSTTG